jgi:ABC-type multidrug transport system fused ATPase/permease subunit
MAHLTKWQGIVALICQVLSINVLLWFGVLGIFIRHTINATDTNNIQRNLDVQSADLLYFTGVDEFTVKTEDVHFSRNVNISDGFMTLLHLLQRMMGALFVSYSCGAGLLLLPLLCDYCASSIFHQAASYTTGRTTRTLSLYCLRLSAVLTSLLAFSMIVTVLLNSLNSNGSRPDIHNNTWTNQLMEEERSELVDLSRIYFVFLSIGMTVLSLSSVSLMATFWPVPYRSVYAHANNNPRHGASIVAEFPESTSAIAISPSAEQDPLLDPLLTENDDNYHLMEDGAPPRTPNNATETLPTVSNEVDMDGTIPVSSVNPTGSSVVPPTQSPTRRLLQLAAPEALYLYIGCAVLLCRLPFSLAIPHFVSTTLAALMNSDFHGAHGEVRLLLIVGTIDAVLDFWAFFLFGYANQRIVRGLRVDLFRRLLGQEVAFFDSHSSGELASRLNSDCSEMAADLTWFFRFSIESVVRITGISAYMLIRCPILGACAVSIIPAVAGINKIYGDWLRQNAIKVQDALADANEVAQEALSNIRTVIAFVAESQECHRYEDRIEHQYQLNIKQLFMTALYYMGKSHWIDFCEYL